MCIIHEELHWIFLHLCESTLIFEHNVKSEDYFKNMWKKMFLYDIMQVAKKNKVYKKTKIQEVHYK